MYNARASEYDNSFHPDFARHIVESLALKPGEHLLDLACGTGLVTLLAAKAVGPSGSVVGVDVTEGMLAELRRKRDEKPGAYENVTVYQHDVTKLSELDQLREASFDAISLASALPLLREPGLALVAWFKYLKPGGRIITDFINPNGMPAIVAMEHVYNHLGLEFSSNRLWCTDDPSLRLLLQQAGFEVENLWWSKSTGAEPVYHEKEAWEAKFDELVRKPPCKTLVDAGLVEKARPLFMEEWAKLAVHEGKVKEVDGVWVILARKPASPDPIAARGSCACSKINWSTSHPKADSASNCHCSTCRKLSGSPYITFINLPAHTLTYSPPLGAPYLRTFSASKFATRDFCGECGSTLSMWYRKDPGVIAVAAGTLDENQSAGGWFGGADNHIYIGEVPRWYTVPEDGVRRLETMSAVGRLLEE
jgi:ubiquinone/menaquinone biosynthesis C-methylase UbiE